MSRLFTPDELTRRALERLLGEYAARKRASQKEEMTE